MSKNYLIFFLYIVFFSFPGCVSQAEIREREIQKQRIIKQKKEEAEYRKYVACLFRESRILLIGNEEAKEYLRNSLKCHRPEFFYLAKLYRYSLPISVSDSLRKTLVIKRIANRPFAKALIVLGREELSVCEELGTIYGTITSSILFLAEDILYYGEDIKIYIILPYIRPEAQKGCDINLAERIEILKKKLMERARNRLESEKFLKAMTIIDVSALRKKAGQNDTVFYREFWEGFITIERKR